MTLARKYLLLIVHTYLPKGLGTGSVSLIKVKRTNKQSLIFLNAVEDTMKQSWMENLLPGTEGFALQAWTMQ
jgi:hypothetical protein